MKCDQEHNKLTSSFDSKALFLCASVLFILSFIVSSSSRNICSTGSPRLYTRLRLCWSGSWNSMSQIHIAYFMIAFFWHLVDITNINRLVVPPVRLSTVGSRAFAVAAPHIWNRLPTDVVAANSLSTFRRLLKRVLFQQSYPDIIYWLSHHPISGPCSGCAT